MVVTVTRLTRRSADSTWDGLICPEPSCRTRLDAHLGECAGCGRSLTFTAGLLDVRDASDRYLPLDAERQRAELLDTLAHRHQLGVSDLARVYYAITGDPRRERFLAHLDRAEARAEGLVNQILDHVPYGGRVLELGCGSGGFLVEAARSRPDWRLEGVDLASRWLVAAKRRLHAAGLDFRTTTMRISKRDNPASGSVRLIAACAERLPFRHGWFDAVVADSLVEHLDDPRKMVDELRRVVRPGGRVVLWSPNRWQWLDDPHGLRGRRSDHQPNRFSSDAQPFWKPHCRTAREAASWFARSDWSSVVVEPAGVTRRWLSRLAPGWERLGSVYGLARRRSPLRDLLTACGPLWQLTAIRNESEQCL